MITEYTSSGYFALDWCELSWTPWIPLNGSREEYRILPTVGGVYRIRSPQRSELLYIGQTRDLRARLRMLSSGTYQELIPFNDPHTAAPNLWVWRIEEGYTYEASVAFTPLDGYARQGLEDMLLWKHRIESHRSTLCNYGRFHPQYTRSGSRKSKKRGKKMPPGQVNPASGPSAPPLLLSETPADRNWMNLSWSEAQALQKTTKSNIPHTPGVYKILDAATQALLYVGQSQDLHKRIQQHATASWAPFSPFISFCSLPSFPLEHQLHEVESDLLGAFYFIQRQPPYFQYGNHNEDESVGPSGEFAE